MEEIEEIQQLLITRIAETKLAAGAQAHRRELKTSRAALKALKQLLAEMRLQLSA